MTAESYMIIVGTAIFMAISAMLLFRKFVSKAKTYDVVLFDYYSDCMDDNDDMEDIPSLAAVTYDEKGEILRTESAGYGFCVSPPEKQAHFFETCGVNIYGGMAEYKKFSAHKEA